VIDVVAKQVTHVIALAEGSNPVGIAVTANGATAVVAESGKGKAAVIKLATFMVTTEIATGPGPQRVGIGGTQAVVVNGDNDTVSIINLVTNTVSKTLNVGRAPDGIAVDPAANRAYVLNGGDGTVSVIDLAAQTVSSTVPLGGTLRPQSIALSGTGFAFITVPSAGPTGEVEILNLAAATHTTIQANPERSGGSTDVAFFNGKLYFANQTGGSVSVIPFTNGTAGAASTIKVDLGARALAIDAKDNLLVVTNEGSGTLVLVDLATNKLTGRIDAVRAAPDDNDDHGDRDRATNVPAVQSVAPASSKANATITLTIVGSNLSGATGIVFALSLGNGNQGDDGNDKNKLDDAFTVSNIAVNSAGTQLTATVKIGTAAHTGAHIVRVTTANGESSGKVGAGNIFTVLP
jgi:YVTN family beta-propeller protein